MNERWMRRPIGANWGEFGPDDQIGRINLITPERRRAGAAEIREGITFCLSLPLDLPGGSELNPNRRPPQRHVAIRKLGRPSVNYPLRLEDPRYIDASCDDSVTIFTQYSTQWDALSHVGQHFDADGDDEAEVVYYNGYRGGIDIQGPEAEGGSYARKLGIERLAESGVQGRAVLIDLEREFGRARRKVSFADLMRAISNQNVIIETGDMVCLHTGFAQMVLDMAGHPDIGVLHDACAVLDGRDDELLRWIDTCGMSALIADNYAVEAVPNAPDASVHHCTMLPLHEQCLFKLGIHLGELWYLTELAGWLGANDRNRFFLTAPPLRLPGSFGSPATPVATV